MDIKNALSKKRIVTWSIAIWGLYIGLLCLVSYYHEPWHDEGQAWLIARDDSLWNLLMYTLHLEGHPPLWYLCLMPFAKLGVPFELGIKAVNIFFCAVAMWFFIIKSRFPYYMKFLFPFTYYAFYQTGVINRSYSLIMAALMIAAYYYPLRREKPYHEACALAIVAGSQAYGMMVSAGIALAWIKEFLNNNSNKIVRLFNEREGKALVFLFIIVFIFGLCMLPSKSTAFLYGDFRHGIFTLIRFFDAIFLIPYSLFYGNDLMGNLLSQNEGLLRSFIMSHNLISSEMLLTVISIFVRYTTGVVFIICTFLFAKNGHKLCLLILPVFLYGILSSLVYWNNYHASVLLFYYIFLYWQLFNSNGTENNLNKYFNFTIGKNGILTSRVIKVLIFISLFINIGWSFSASHLDILFPYDVGRDVAEYIKNNNLQKSIIWAEPGLQGENDGMVIFKPYAVNCYFKKNIFANLDGGSESYAYHNHKIMYKKDIYTELSRLGKPLYILHDNDVKTSFVNDVYGEKIVYKPYKTFYAYRVWKDHADKKFVVLSVRQP